MLQAPTMSQPKTPVLVSDFDGTMTRYDFYQLVRNRWWDGTEPDPWERYLARELTHFEALNCFFGRIRADEAEMRGVIEQMELDPTLPAALDRLHQSGWKVVIDSVEGTYIPRSRLRAAGRRCFTRRRRTCRDAPPASTRAR